MQQPVDRRDGYAGTIGDAGAARAVDDLRVAPLFGGHRPDDRFGAVDLLLVELLQFLAVLRHAGDHAEQRLHRAELAHLLQLVHEVVESELAFRHLLGGLAGLLLVELLLRLFDQGKDIAHVEDARGHAIGVEDLEVLEPFAGRGEQDRLAGHARHRQRRTAAGVAVELGQHHAGEIHALVERLGRLDGVLADHCVDDEQDLVGVHGIADVAGLLHQRFVDAQSAGGIDDDRVVQLLLG